MKFHGITLLTLLIMSGSALAAARRDISGGLVYPSTNSSVYENPGAMVAVGSDQSLVDLTAYLDTDFSVGGGHGGYAKAKDYYAYGVHLTQSSIAGGFGLKIKSSFHVGLGVDYAWEGGGLRVPAGIWTSLSGGLKVGAVVTSLPNVYSGGVGIAGTVGSGAIVELDMLFFRSAGSIDPQGVNLRPAFVYSASKKFSFKAAYEFPLFPEAAPGRGVSSFATSYWIADTLALYVGYRDFTGGGTYQVGIRAGKN